MAPQDIGFTVSQQPTLYWYLSSDWDWQMEFTLNEIGKREPVAALTLGIPINKTVHSAGINHLNLADFDISLQSNREYEWFITIVPDIEQRSGDLLASGTIKYMDASPILIKQLNQTPKELHYKIYAEAGIWYDAIDHLCQQIELHPHNKELRKIRASLSKQVAMPKVAHYDE